MHKEIEQFYTDNYDLLCRRVNFRAGGICNAEDVVQEAFTRAIKYINSFDNSSREFGAWFNTILNNSLRDFKRDELTYGTCSPLEEADGETYCEELQLSEGQLKRALVVLSDQSREILRLNVTLGYTPKEISEVTGIPRKTVRNKLLEIKSGIVSLLSGE